MRGCHARSLASLLLAAGVLCLALQPGVSDAQSPATKPETQPRRMVELGGPWKVYIDVLSGTESLQMARTADGWLHVPMMVPADDFFHVDTPASVDVSFVVKHPGIYWWATIDDTSCTDLHDLATNGQDLVAVAGGLPIGSCTSDEMVSRERSSGSLFPNRYGGETNDVQWGNHSYNAGGENLALLYHPTGVLLTAYTAPEGMVIGHSGANYGPDNPTPVLDNCCGVNFPNLALDGATGNVWASWWKQGPGEPEATVRVLRIDPATGTALGAAIDLKAPKAQAKKFQTAAATQRTALSGLPGRPGVYAAFLGRGKRDIDYPTVWIQGLDTAGCECPGGSKPKRVFGSYASTDLYHEVAVAAGAHSFWVLAAVYVGDPGEYAYVARHWTPKQQWSPPMRIDFPKGVSNGIFDAPTSLMADAQLPDGRVEILSQPSLQSGRLYRGVLRAVEPDAHWKASGSTYKIRLPNGVYVQPKTTGKLRLKKNGAASTVMVDVNIAGQATVHLNGDVKLVSLKIKTGDFTTTYDL